MNELLTRRPDRPLPPGTHERLRTDLLSAIENEPTRPPRRILAPALAAAAVLAVVAGLAIGVRAFRTDTAPPASGPATVRALTADETASLRTQCLAEANRITSKSLPHPFTDYKVVKAFEFTGVKDPNVVSTWLIGFGNQTYPTIARHPMPERSHPAYWLCSRTAGGAISEPSIRFSPNSILSGAPSMRIARNAGVYTKTVKANVHLYDELSPRSRSSRRGSSRSRRFCRTVSGSRRPLAARTGARTTPTTRAAATSWFAGTTPPAPCSTPTADRTRLRRRSPAPIWRSPCRTASDVPSPPVKPECVEYRWPS